MIVKEGSVFERGYGGGFRVRSGPTYILCTLNGGGIDGSYLLPPKLSFHILRRGISDLLGTFVRSVLIPPDLYPRSPLMM